MRCSIQSWVFDIDIEATAAYAADLYADHCECGYCRNYYSAVGKTYPALIPFLEQFGVNIESPVDFLPVEPTLCIVSYPVCGRIIERGDAQIFLDGLTVTVHDSTELDYTLSCGSPYFVFTTAPLELPWLLDEDMNEVISPANEPECLDRMWRKLLQDTDLSLFGS